MFNKISVIVILFFILGLFSLSFSQQESVTITTYHSSPYGSYQELRTSRMAVSPTRTMPTTNGTLAWGEDRGLLTTDQGASIELGGTGDTPYIDFSNDLASDFDARIILPDDNTLRINVGDKVEVRNRDNSNWQDIYVKCIGYNWGTGIICQENLDVIN
jgi:hypothetical protein